MNSRGIYSWMILSILTWAIAAPKVFGQTGNQGNDFTEQQKIDFLTHAKVIHSAQTETGVTAPFRLTLTNGTVTHDALFQVVHDHKTKMEFQDGTVEFNFKDYWEFDIAGYQLAKLLGMDNMVPVTTERHWNGNSGAIEWWVPNVAMNALQRRQRHIEAPDPDAWNKQMYKIRVFDELIYDMDPNLTNVLITKDWKIWRIDFTRAFRSWKRLKNPKNLVMCDKGLLSKLKALNEDELTKATAGYLSKSQIKAVMARRDLIVKQFNKLIAKNGEAAVLY